MALSILTALSLTVIYRITLNLPDLPYSQQLRQAGSHEFLRTSKQISTAVDQLLERLDGEHRSSVFQYRYHQVIGTLVYLDVYSDIEDPQVRETILKALHDGIIGDIPVSNEGFEFHIIKDSNDKCPLTSFQCLDGSCIPLEARCDNKRDCLDGSDENSKHSKCKQHQPVIYQTDRIVSSPSGGIIHLSAIIDMNDDHQVIWSKDDKILGENSLSTAEDDRINVYRTKDQYFLRIENVTTADAGQYKILIEGMPVEALFEVRVTSDKLMKSSEGCPEGERSCLSGHCLPVSSFCDRIIQCPDGDDEQHCSPVKCTSLETQCESDNICIPSTNICDGWNDCRDGSDERNCSSVVIRKPHHPHQHKKHSRLTVTCEDGSAPQYSLHGSSYCWSNSVCPTTTTCVQGLCCETGRNEKRSVDIECNADQFRCDNGQCIPNNQHCNRKYECSDGSDEIKCEYYIAVMKHHAEQQQKNISSSSSSSSSSSTSSSPPTTAEVSPSSHNTQQQSQSHGVHHATHHESNIHRGGRTDECSDQEFRCPYLIEDKCIHYDKLCDGNNDCGDGSDEVNCESGSREDLEIPDAEEQQKQERERLEQHRQNLERQREQQIRERQREEAERQRQESDRSRQEPDRQREEAERLRQHHEAERQRQGQEAERQRQEPDRQREEAERLRQREEAERQRQPPAAAQQQEGRCTIDQFQCKNGNCISKSDECNRKYDCQDGSDETECEYFKAAMNRNHEEQQPTREDENKGREEEIRRREEELRRREESERRREQETSQREAENRRREESERKIEEEERKREESERRHTEEERRREGEERRRLEEERRRIENDREQIQRLPPPVSSPEVVFKDEYDDDVACLDHEFQCHTGECIDKRRICDTRLDCLDGSDEEGCSDKRKNGEQLRQDETEQQRHPAVPPTTTPVHIRQQPQQHRNQDIDADGANRVQITIYPTEIQIREGRDVTFDCRARTADNSQYPEVRWTRVGGPLPPHAHESTGRLTINPVSLSDAGQYICVSTHNGQTVEAQATLNVQSFGPQELQGLLPSSGSCMADEKACGNNECVKNDYVCDGEPDCRDRSDEANCPAMRQCEPNEFRCNNQRCVQKMWLCDGDDDCGDNSDETNCGSQNAGEMCKPTEFQCSDRRQCVPTSFHCDGTNDCKDGSDEVGCVQPTVVQPPETNMQVPIGDTFKLTCKAVAVPEAYINWRLNWGPVCDPPRCLQTSEGGFGTLTVTNAQPMDQGAYTCEAINVKGRVLATPDCIVRIVNIPNPTPPPRPPPPPQPNCDTRGAVSPYPDRSGRCECKPLVTGPTCNECRPGSFHLTEKSPQGCLKCFCFGITDQCRSSSWYRTKDRLLFENDAEGVTISDVEERNIEQNAQFSFQKTGFLTLNQQLQGTKYWRLPQRFLGDKVTAYGGKMEIEVEYSGSGQMKREPIIVLKGNQNILVHRIKNQEQTLQADRPNRIVVETYETNYEQMNGQPATREDLLMVLADLDAFLIRSTHVENQYSTSLGDVSWEISVDRFTQDGVALEVEQCSCPPGYIGTSCEDCAPGYERSGHGPWLGTCVPQQQRQQCTGPGAVSTTANFGGQCQCKTYATGPNCDQCPPNSFYMAPTNPQGCIPCFCSGVTQQCQSSSYSRAKIEINYPRGDRDQLVLSSSDSRSPFTPQTPGYVSAQSIEFSSFHEANGQTLYWKLPSKFLGDKVTSYGGELSYTFRYSGEGRNNQDAHIIIRGNDITLQYTHKEPIYPDRDNTISLKIFEDRWQRVDGQQATREHLLMALADLDDILIKATYMDECSQSSLISVTLEHAEPYGRGGLTALEVEQCQCPPGYVGTSCEDCAPGYSRTGGGLYLGLCEKCECHGHANQCDKEYGFCVDCQHNTEGDQCERCKPGFVGDARRGTPHDCQPAATRPPCQCNNHSPRGCDSFGRCLLCEHNTEGTHCERCKKGYYGDSTKGTPYDCTACPCPGASDCYLDQNGAVACRNCPAGLSGKLCNECAPGYTRSRKEEGRTCEPIGSVTSLDKTYVPPPPEGGRIPEPDIDPPHLTVNEGDEAVFRCWVPGIPDCQITWHKEFVGGPLPHGVYQTGNSLKISRAEMSHAGNYICSATNQYGIGKSPLARLDVVRPTQRPRVDPAEQTVDEGSPARFRCWLPGSPDAQLEWHRQGGAPLPSGVQQQQGMLQIPRASQNEAGQYVCTATDPRNGQPQQSDPVRLNIRPPAQRAGPQVDPPEQTVNEGDPIQIRCWVAGDPSARLKWSRQDGQPLSSDVTERDGFLRIASSKKSDAGNYICTSTDPNGRHPPANSTPARVNVNSGPIVPQVDPPEQTVNVGEPSRIRCWVPGQPNIRTRWAKQNRAPLPSGSSDQDGHLSIPRTQKADEGFYVCTAYDPSTNAPVEAPPARINVRPSEKVKPLVDPVEQSIPEGNPFSIRCWVPGHPNLPVTWRRIDGHLNDIAEQQRGVLSIRRSELSDDGEYVCSANDPTDGTPVDSAPALVHVTSPTDESPQVSPPSQTVSEHDPASIKCWVDDHPEAVLSWRRVDGSPLPFGSSDQRGILSIPSALKSDEGDFICTYHPQSGRNKESPISKLFVTTPGSPPHPIATPPLQTVRRGSPARFHCDAHSDTPATISWRYENGEFPDGVTVEGDDIIISRADDDNVGEYYCTAKNPYGTGDAPPVRLAVTDDEQPPTARVEPRVWNGKPGDRHQFKCIVTGVPTPTVKWTGPDNTPLAHDVTELEGNLLDFSNGRTELNGDYTCTATNPIGEASDHGSVNIGPSLIVKTTPAGNRLILTVGEPLLVKCEAFGEPDPEVEWLHDPGPERGDLPDDFKPVTISEQFIKHPAIGLGNAGLYTCKGSNSHATATKNIYIEVVEPSRVATVSILGGSSQWFDQGSPSELICTATGSSLVDRLEWIKVDDQLPTDVEEHNEPGLLHFPNFKNSYAGEYECRGFRNDELIASSTVHVHSANEDTEDARVEIEPPRVRVVSQGESIVLKCSVEGAKNGEHFEWALLRGGNLVRKLGNEATLTIQSAKPDNDYGVYRCNVEDDNGVVVGSAFTAVTVGFDGEHNAQITKFDDKTDGSFTCPVYSVPGSKVEWSRHDGELPPTAVPNGNKLEIKNFDEKSAGLYVCKVTIDNQVVSGYVQAQIFVPDTIIQVLLEVSSESVNVGDRAWFDCKVTGDPNAAITWFKEGSDELPSNAQVTGGRLQFNEATEDNAGVYKCRAKTKAGPLETRSVLNIGSTKRKRHYQHRGRHNHRQHNKRHSVVYEQKKDKQQQSIFGSWFSTQ